MTDLPATPETIEDVLRRAQAGDRVLLAPGTYRLPPVLPAGVTLQGASGGPAWVTDSVDEKGPQ